jgi:carboxymethylenebutenolidase
MPQGLTTQVTDIDMATPGGICDVALVEPQGEGQWPAVIMFPDVLGLRAATRQIAERLSSDGFVVLVPNPFYRSTPAPGVTTADLNFQDPAIRAKLGVLRAPMTNEAIAADARATVTFLESRPTVDRSRKMGVVGYCMGGLMTLQAAAGAPDRVGAGASIHGAGLVTDSPGSPHLLVPALQAEFYFAVATNDDQREPHAKGKLAEAFHAARLPVKIEVYEGALHGWCMKDMPSPPGGPAIYNEQHAERARREITTLMKRAL